MQEKNLSRRCVLMCGSLTKAQKLKEKGEPWFMCLPIFIIFSDQMNFSSLYCTSHLAHIEADHHYEPNNRDPATN